MRSLRLRDGDALPAIGLGTWKARPHEVGAVVEAALRLGYRHMDCAPIYGNEKEIGMALSACLGAGWVARESLWVTSKLWNNAHGPDDVIPALQQTLSDLRLSYLDAYLMHWPVAIRQGVQFPQSARDFVSLRDIPLAQTWAQMERAVALGLCRHIGVANFGVRTLASLIETARTIPEINQIELHPYLQQTAVVEFCQGQGVAITAYASLGSADRPRRLLHAGEPAVLEDPVVCAIAAQLAVTPAQVLLAWSLHRGAAVIPKSVQPARLRENLAAGDTALDPAQMQALAGLDKGWRYVDGAMWAVPGTDYTIKALWA
jgi:alcohol dehydrogenase (NADP+)